MRKILNICYVLSFFWFILILLKINNQIKALLADNGVKNIIDNSVSAEEAQSKLKQFLSK